MRTLILLTLTFSQLSIGYDPELLNAELSEIENEFLYKDSKEPLEKGKKKQKLVNNKKQKVQDLESIYFDTVSTKKAGIKKMRSR